MNLSAFIIAISYNLNLMQPPPSGHTQVINPGPSIESTQAGVIRSFYKVALSEDRSGLPAEELTKKASPFLSKALFSLINQAREGEKQFFKLHPNERESYFQGNIFVAPGEGASQILSISPKEGTPANVFLVRFGNAPESNQQYSTPINIRVVLIYENSKWVVDNIFYYLDSLEPNNQSLRTFLESGIAGMRASR